MNVEQTQVAIIGGGPSGLLLGQLLHQAGIDNIIIERQSKDHVLGRIRAGVLERGLIRLLQEAGVADRAQAEGYPHDGIVIGFNNEYTRIGFKEHVDKPVVVYGQTEVTRDLYVARDNHQGRTFFTVEDVTIQGLDSNRPSIEFKQANGQYRIECDYIAGCDGFHGVSRQAIPAERRREYEKIYPFGWLGVLSETPPVHDELIYANSDHGFALCSMRNSNLSRYYVQCHIDDSVDNWSDERFWQQVQQCIPQDFVDRLQTGPSIEKSIAPLRSFVCEPMQWKRLYLCGDAAHIVPPTGAKGLNTAASDVHYLFNALKSHYWSNDSTSLENYSETALARVWKAERFSWWMTQLLHQFPEHSTFDKRMQRAEFELLQTQIEAQANLAVNYVGLPY